MEGAEPQAGTYNYLGSLYPNALPVPPLPPCSPLSRNAPWRLVGGGGSRTGQPRRLLLFRAQCPHPLLAEMGGAESLAGLQYPGSASVGEAAGEGETEGESGRHPYGFYAGTPNEPWLDTLPR